MATWVVDDTASGAGTGADWTNAYVTLEAAISAKGGTGNTFLIAATHTEGKAGALSITGGTIASPMILISVTPGGGATQDGTYSLGAEISNTGNVDLTLAGITHSFGVDFTAGDDIFTSTDDHWRIEDSTITPNGNGGQGQIFLGNADNSWHFRNCTFAFLHSTSQIFMDDGTSIVLEGCSTSGTTATQLISAGGSRGGTVLINGLDLTGLASTGNLTTPPAAGNSPQTIRGSGVLLPSSGGVTSSAYFEPGSRIELWNVDTANTRYGIHIEDYYGLAVTDTANHIDSDQILGESVSIKIVTTANCIDGLAPFRVPLPSFYADANQNITVEFINAGTTFQNDEVWIEIYSPDSTTGCLHNRDATSRPAPLATADPLTTSSATWTEVLAGEVRQSITETITGGQAGQHQVVVCVAKPSATIYVSPVPTVAAP